ncbi:MAG: hypothetical protein N4A64_02175 [Marinisporobacter sp.]|nr:hypothetical protein [Marinisporobacter sp.]
MIKLSFGLDKKDGKIYHISEVRNGLDCNCICPHCKQDLIACNNGTKQEYHFRHYIEECKYALETALHLFAKEVIDKHKKIRVPQFSVNSYIERIEVLPEKDMYFEKIELESLKFKGIIDKPLLTISYPLQIMVNC